MNRSLQCGLGQRYPTVVAGRAHPPAVLPPRGRQDRSVANFPCSSLRVRRFCSGAKAQAPDGGIPWETSHQKPKNVTRSRRRAPRIKRRRKRLPQPRQRRRSSLSQRARNPRWRIGRLGFHHFRPGRVVSTQNPTEPAAILQRLWRCLPRGERPSRGSEPWIPSFLAPRAHDGPLPLERAEVGGQLGSLLCHAESRRTARRRLRGVPRAARCR